VYLKSLEIQGFKSFPDKTVLQFGSDVTAIVGPNGSGKSNISDAISWVLGEQSSKALRGAKMEDVIFGGTQKRPAVGFAEATLVLDNADGALAIETPEVMITRRYYRSGESEYYINRESARLRDINELFMDTGLGREGYSNIGQGKIDEILSVKSTDRREVFEEAAGISKYRYRKEETERRLDATEENLLRIGDKISELELQVEPLREQAEKAKKYLAFKDELRGLEVTVWLDALKKVAESAKKAETDYASSAFILEQAHDELTKLYSKSEQLSLQLNQQTLLLDREREEISALEQERQQRETERSVSEADCQNRQRNIERVRLELSEQKSRSGGVAEQAQEQQERIEALEKELLTLAHILAAQQAQETELAQKLAAEDEAKAGLAAQQTLLQNQLSQKNAEIASLGASMDSVKERAASLADECAAARKRKEEAEAQKREAGRKRDEAKEAVTSANNAIAGYELRRKARADRRDKLQKELSAAGVSLDTLASKARMLQEMEREYEGFSRSVKLVMQEAERGVLKNVRGPVSKLISVPDEYTTAIETALGAAMQNVVVDTEEDGKAAIRMLKQRDAGRATFLPISAIRGKTLQESGLERQKGYLGIASELVRTDKEYRNIVDNLLGRTVAAENLDDAVAMAKAYGSRFRIVTLDGQVMNPGGSMTGGSASKSSGVLSRANELQKLESQRAELEQRKKTLQQAAQEAESAVAKVEFEMSAVQGELRRAEDEVLRREEEEKQLGLLLEAVSANLRNCEEEQKRLESRGGSDGGKLEAAQKDADRLARNLDELAAQEQALGLRRQALAQELDGVRQKLGDCRRDTAAREAEKAAAEKSKAQLGTLIEAMRGDSEQKKALIAQYEQEIRDLEAKMEAAAGELSALKAKTDEKRETLNQDVQTRTELEGRRNRAEKDAQEKNQNIVQLERETARLEQKKATGELEEKQLVDKLWDNYELTPSTAEEKRVDIESLAAANKRIAEVKRRISALGPVNPGAIEDYARVSERYEYLTGQRDDVEKAREELSGIVESITKEMTAIFLREFTKINELFGQTFTEMFGGGKASLELEDRDDPLGCGIEIRVQPPGKQLKTITLLSGGEKAFVAIALYFAILKVRPTPFCMLDEIDAALDDSNVGRFAAYLRNLCDKTQFIVITHRRGTMEAADVLYGVTMQEQGISKILHLNLDEMEHSLGITG
jgi:chromosome segregation protein